MQNRVRKSLNASVVDGIYAALTAGIVDNYVTPFALALQANASQIATLAAIPSLFAAFTQLQAGPLRYWARSRKAILLGGVGFQMLSLFALSAVPWFPAGHRLIAVLVIVTCYSAIGGLVTPMWCSLMSRYLPLSRRSGYFGWRNRVLGLVGIVATTAAGLLLHDLGTMPRRAFAVLFFLAGLCRLISLRYLSRLYEPSTPTPPEGSSYWVSLVRNPHYLPFVCAWGLMAFSVSLSGPFLSMHMLKDLRFGYGTYTVMILASQLTMCWMMGRWGRSADRAGNIRVVKLTARFLPITALLWILFKNPLALLGVQLFSGLVWAGYNLCTMNYLYDSVRTSERVHATALFCTVGSLAVFLGAKLGGFLYTVLPPLGGCPFYSLALASALARMIVGWAIFPRLAEIRDVPVTEDHEIVQTILPEMPILARLTARFASDD